MTSKLTTDITAVGTSDTDCYVVPKNFKCIIRNLMIANNDSSARTFTFKVFDKVANTTTTVLTSYSVAAKTSTSIFTLDKPLFLQSEDKIILSASTGSVVMAVITSDEFLNLTA